MIAKNKQNVENKTANMRTCLTKFSRIFACGVVLLVLAEQRAICTTRAPCLASQALSFESAQFLLPLVEQRANMHPLFATSPGIAAAV